MSTVVAAFGSCASNLSKNKRGRPNILLLFSDQHNARVLGCYGDHQAHTPNLDRLCDDGMKLRNHYAGSTVCAPVS